LLPQDPYFQAGAIPVPAITMAGAQKVIQHIDFGYDWFAGHNSSTSHNQLGINDIGLSATCAFPVLGNVQTPLLVTPGFAVHYWEGPISVWPTPPSTTDPADLPARTYDAYLDAAWNPQISPWLGAELDARFGVYSDFYRVVNNSFRLTAKGMAVMTLSPSMKIELGIWYLDRLTIKMLPAGGICWSPNPDIKFDILFPNPKISKRLTTMGNTEWWIYASGEYGGGTWSIRRNSGIGAPTDGTNDVFEYDDIRIAAGLEFTTVRQLRGMFEVGVAVSRQVVYQSCEPNAYYPTNTVYLRAGLSY
jgi:hypothetical protein